MIFFASGPKGQFLSELVGRAAGLREAWILPPRTPPGAACTGACRGVRTPGKADEEERPQRTGSNVQGAPSPESAWREGILLRWMEELQPWTNPLPSPSSCHENRGSRVLWIDFRQNFERVIPQSWIEEWT